MLISNPLFYFKKIGIVGLFILIHSDTFAMEPYQKEALSTNSELHLERLKILKDNIDTWAKNAHSLYPKIWAWRQSNDYHSDMCGGGFNSAHFDAENFCLLWNKNSSNNSAPYAIAHYQTMAYAELFPKLIVHDITSANAQKYLIRYISLLTDFYM